MAFWSTSSAFMFFTSLRSFCLEAASASCSDSFGDSLFAATGTGLTGV